jgi:hypothetical protein
VGKGKEEGNETHRETIAGAMRLVMRSVAVTLTLMILASSSGDVSAKSAGISWDTPTLLTVGRAGHHAERQAQVRRIVPFSRKWEREARTEYADFDRFELLKERRPPRIVGAGKVDDERLGLHGATTPARFGYVYILCVQRRELLCVSEEQQNQW